MLPLPPSMPMPSSLTWHDGTLTDSIAAVEAAWGKVAKDIGRDPVEVISATHGKRAIDNLAQFKPSLKEHEMDNAVAEFEETILYYADAFHRRATSLSSFPSSDVSTPYGSNGSSSASSRASSLSLSRPTFATRLSEAIIARAMASTAVIDEDELDEDLDSAWKVEAESVDRSVRILPGVQRMLESIPKGRYAVATSGAKTYAYGCMTRVGITPPEITITADDKRLKAGKPAPDPFLLAAECLGFDPKKCVVVEDSPSGIRAGVASGATVIAVCTSHEREQIANCGAHYIVGNLERVRCEAVRMEGEVRLRFQIDPGREEN
ncbi:hypothetical protein EW146_g721 [Bondarzewia mesenterica]|uniref:HAD-like protein n=1 Tax=Bondarzewia mesenterica TaxID=1095465 RepID=A0A4S4M605_9AGAM|nr:hypothetical protein EW146_g721 [Bondarzewia mesenterica]